MDVMGFIIQALVLCGAGAFIWLFLSYTKRAAKESFDAWAAYPTFELYSAQHPKNRTARGVTCAQCGSGSIRNFGWTAANDTMRVHICNHCGTHLYRTGP